MTQCDGHVFASGGDLQARMTYSARTLVVARKAELRKSIK